MSDEISSLVYKFALINAVQHGGKAQAGPVINKVFGERPELRSKAKLLAPIVEETIRRVNSMSLEEQRRELEREFPEALKEKPREEERKTLPPLINLKGKVVTRFAPNPDGPIHLGNARPALLSYEYARMYQGEFILRFDDTDPRVKKPIREAYDWIREDLKWLGVSWNAEFAASNRLERYYEVAKEMIDKGYAYVDTCSEKEFKSFRAEKKACPHRGAPSEVNLGMWDRMLSGHFREGEAVVRIKTDIKDPDPSQVDWVMLRIIDTTKSPHPLVGERYIVWPTYNFATVVDDHDTRVSHILRAKEHISNTRKQEWVYRYMNWQMPEVIQFGRLKLEGFMMSKSKIRGLMQTGSARDDPRLPTIAALRRRGILPDTIKEIIMNVGLKITDAVISFDNIAAINRKKLDKMAKRLMFVPSPFTALKFKYDQEIQSKIPFHPSNPNKYRQITVRPGDRVLVHEEDAKKGRLRLMDLCNVEIRGDEALCISTDLSEAKKEGYEIVQWVKESEAVRVEVIRAMGDQLKSIQGYGEQEVTRLELGEIAQFVRFGFVRTDLKKDHTIRFVFSHD